MRSFTKVFGTPIACVFGIVALFAANAAESPRAVRASQTQSARMPTMPISTVDAVQIPDNNTNNSGTPNPDNPPKPDDPKPECPDGGVRNSEYGVTECMNDILSCINNGALGGGLNDLFNSDLRDSVIGGNVGLCSVFVDKCITSVRRDCATVYGSATDVWTDFDSRKIQPEYYTFVLRKTGLTPNQAENTCLMLNGATGSSFTATINTPGTTNTNIGPSNMQMGNVTIKTTPAGTSSNGGTMAGGNGGNFARWDPTTATCYLRVAAYNKDEQIKNSWLFGALGDDKMAEVWRAAGDTFSCNKDLFGFSLLNDTDTAAVVGVGGGTLLGAGIGAIAGHGERAFDCSNASALKTLNEQIKNNRPDVYILNSCIASPFTITPDRIDRKQCEAIVDLYTRYESIRQERENKICYGNIAFNCDFDVDALSDPENILNISLQKACADGVKTEDCIEELRVQNKSINVDGYGQCFVDLYGCRYAPLCGGENSFIAAQKCEMADGNCADADQTMAELKSLRSIFDKLTVLHGEKSNMGKSIRTGAAIGAGTGGVATAITAFVERNNISCRVGDNLDTVSFGKSHSIGTLKDFYVKWNLRLPDTILPASNITDCAAWKSACATFTGTNQCKSVAVNYKPTSNGPATLVRSACVMMNGSCQENAVVAKSYSACE